jgi:hypothetical protein
MSDNTDFTDEPKRGDHDITGQPPRPSYDYEPDDDIPRRPGIRRRQPWSAANVTVGCVIVALGAFTLGILILTVCHTLGL